MNRFIDIIGWLARRPNVSGAKTFRSPDIFANYHTIETSGIIFDSICIGREYDSKRFTIRKTHQNEEFEHRSESRLIQVMTMKIQLI
jgi:hypothetical protein